MTGLSRYAVECRAEVAGRKLVGHAAVFDQVADLGPWGLEQLARGAFDKVLADPATDVRALLNHNPDQLLGRQSAGTLRLSVDDTGLEFEIDLPDTTVGRDVRELAGRGDLSGASFAFIPGEEEWSKAGKRQLRTHTSVKTLVDVSPVTFPAYAAASVALRALEPAPDLTHDRADSRSQLIRARHRARIRRDT